MKNIEKYKSLLETGEVDALLLTSEYNRLYAAQYSIAEGVAVVTKDGAYYFTDSRYIEAAENNLPGFTVRRRSAPPPAPTWQASERSRACPDALPAHARQWSPRQSRK